MLPEKLLLVLKNEGVVAIATQGTNGPHLVNSWNSYIQITDKERLLIPAGFMNETEQNIARDERVLVTVGSREVQGKHGPGTGFLIAGKAAFLKSGPEFDSIKKDYPWARAALEIKIENIEQTL